jgi:hypothetical protein
LEQLNTISFYDIFETIEIISLETKDESLIKEITKVRIFDDYIYIYDRSYSGRLIVYDSNGNYIRKIGIKGEGPDDYIDISDFSLDEKSKKIIILSSIANCLIEYTFEGNFIRKVKLPQIENGTYSKMTIINKDTIAFWTSKENAYYLKYYSINSDVIVNEEFVEERKDIFCQYVL